MLYIWLVIITGVILVPIISGATKELENRLENMGEENEEGIKIWKFTFDDKEDIKSIIKVLTYTLIAIFAAVVIMMVKFTGNVISNS